ncbi:MAG TPA: alpha/beta hydrolase [Acidimicrobiales bacterium]|nr:alpha/beta hydrolase [Acidimicrobiales bacterium]
MTSDQPETLTVTDGDGVTIYVYRWVPAGDPKAAVHIAHGMGEHARRYDHVADRLTSAGYVVYADDHRASGRTGAEGAGLGNLGPRGMEGAVESLHDVLGDVGQRDPGAPMFLLGHSWGSFLAQRVADRWGSELAGLILSGSTLLTEEYANLGDPNARFEPAETRYDWLSRDPNEVQKYIDDPWCGFEVAFDMGELLHLAGPPADTVPPGLPVLVLNGTEDAVGGFTGGGRALADAYGELGLTDVTFQSYPGARHELFNETNREEVLSDLVGWLDRHAG